MPARTKAKFKAIVHSEAEGGYWATVPDLPGCFTRGDSLDEVYHNLTESIACHLSLETDAVRISVLEIAPSPQEIYSGLDLGPGGYAIAPSTDSRRGVREAIQKKLGR